MESTLASLGEICDKYGGIIRTGPFGSQLHQSDYKPEGIPVIMPKDIINGKVQTDSIARIGPNDARRLERHSLKKGDIVYGRRGDIGRRAIITEKEAGWICGTGCLRISLNPEVVEPLYLYYYLGQKDVSDWIYNQAIGATLPNLNTQIIRSVEINCLPFQTQQRIAAILSTHDELIETNKKRIALLEKMAEEIYREWFVRLRFPGYQGTGFVKGVPELWEVKKIGDVIKAKYGYTESALIDDSLPKYLRVMDINKNSYIDWDTVPNCKINQDLVNTYRLLKNDIVIARMASPGKVAIIEQEMIAVFASYLIKLIPDRHFLSPYYLFYTLSNDYYQGIFINADSSATRGSINGKTISNFPIIIPPMEIQLKFCKIIEPLRATITCNLRSNNNLRTSRDLLLFRLLSGKLSVEDLNIQFPKSMEDDYAELHQ